TTYSSKGPSALDHVVKPDLVAPGNKIFAVRAIGSFLDTENPAPAAPLSSYEVNPAYGDVSNYMVLSGTSMAAAVTSGSAAVLIGSQGLTPDQVKARLMKTATKNFPQSSVINDPTT